ncbi:hypothetical protein C1H46_030181 [Malus baccata]|uniref:Uncharacterized protein n=1 Tax=Malus baccata TaxID=106549 RepID=A0A540LCV7_MALBA|nr:hypothetical protein C1H46_030181 [Malus baccata]
MVLDLSNPKQIPAVPLQLDFYHFFPNLHVSATRSSNPSNQCPSAHQGKYLIFLTDVTTISCMNTIRNFMHGLIDMTKFSDLILVYVVLAGSTQK